ncbi:MAG: endonuclease, partial [Planctomycetes bacterium]|nr:endonuclease [Planctomycetota bacterium]
GLTCYSLQNHLRTKVKEIGQVEVDEIYVGVDRKGSHHVLPVQAKGGKDQINIVQIQQDMAMCAVKFAALQCRPIAGQFMSDDLIALFEFTVVDGEMKIVHEKHYRLVPADEIDADEIKAYQSRTD